MAKRNYTLDNPGNDEVSATPALMPETPAAQTQTPDVPTSAQPSPSLPVFIDSDEGDDGLRGYVEPKVPANLQESFALLGKVSEMPESSKKEKRVKEKMLAFAKSHCHRLQQGLPDVPVSATVNHLTQQVSSLKRYRLETLARTNPDIQELLDDNAAMRARCKVLEEKLAELTAKP